MVEMGLGLTRDICFAALNFSSTFTLSSHVQKCAIEEESQLNLDIDLSRSRVEPCV